MITTGYQYFFHRAELFRCSFRTQYYEQSISSLQCYPDSGLESPQRTWNSIVVLAVFDWRAVGVDIIYVEIVVPSKLHQATIKTLVSAYFSSVFVRLRFIEKIDPKASLIAMAPRNRFIKMSFWMNLVVVLVSELVVVSAMAPPSLKLRVCQGSGCLGKCRGAFNPLASFEMLVAEGSGSNGDAAAATSETATATRIEVEETFCMNQCKRGPNVRMIDNDNGKVLTFDETIMNETELGRKAFQRVVNEDKVKALWGLAKDVTEGTVVATESGFVDKLHDIMPRK